MRIRNVRPGDIPILIDILQMAAATDGFVAKELLDLEAWLVNPELERAYSIFVITDDDESNEWGQGGTLEGVEGEVVGFTAVSLRENRHAYHFLCQGTVHPRYRRRNAGRALLICALNHARIVAAEFEFEAEEEGRPIYLEALLPLHDPASVNLAMKCEMQPADESQVNGMILYRREL